VRARSVLFRLFSLPYGILPGGVSCCGTGFVCVVGSEGEGRAHLKGPYTGLAFDGEGKIVVSDGHDNRLQVFRYSDGAHVHTIDAAVVETDRSAARGE
jgi:hypothetical protein